MRLREEHTEDWICFYTYSRSISNTDHIACTTHNYHQMILIWPYENHALIFCYSFPKSKDSRPWLAFFGLKFNYCPIAVHTR